MFKETNPVTTGVETDCDGPLCIELKAWLGCLLRRHGCVFSAAPDLTRATLAGFCDLSPANRLQEGASLWLEGGTRHRIRSPFFPAFQRTKIVGFLGCLHNRGELQISRKKTVFLLIFRMIDEPLSRTGKVASFDLFHPLLDNDFLRLIFRRLKFPLKPVARCLKLWQMPSSEPHGRNAKRR